MHTEECTRSSSPLRIPPASLSYRTLRASSLTPQLLAALLVTGSTDVLMDVLERTCTMIIAALQVRPAIDAMAPPTRRDATATAAQNISY